MKFIESNSSDKIKDLRLKLYQILKAPIDAMWEKLYVSSSKDYLIEKNGQTLGYCCINENGCLIQIFIEKGYYSIMNNVIEELIKAKLVSSASLSSNEPIGFNACLFHSKKCKANTFCFQHLNKPIDINTKLNLELVSTQEIPNIKIFLKEQIGMNDTFGYTENLVSRKEIFMIKESDVIIATSECRMSDSQPAVADIGIIVNKNHQRKGIGTEVMQLQVNRVLNAGRKPICSTTLDNVASRKAIEKSGFYCSNIIFDMHF